MYYRIQTQIADYVYMRKCMGFIGAGCGLVYKTSLSARLTSKLSPSLIGWYTPAMRQALVCTVGELWSQTGALRRPGRVQRKVGVESIWLCRLGGQKDTPKYYCGIRI